MESFVRDVLHAAMAGAIVPVNSAAGGLLENLPNFAAISGLQGSGVDLISSLPPFGRGDAFFARMINMAFGIMLNTSIAFERLDSLQRQSITSADMISCDFSTPCFWYTEGLEGAQWKWAAKLPNALALLSATNALALPRRPPFVFQYLSGGRGDRLVSVPIACQKSVGILQFNFWKTSDMKLTVCALDAFDQALQCDTVDARGHLSGTTTVAVPASEEPTRIAIFAEGSGFVALDDLLYSAELCQPTPVTTTTTQAPTTTTIDFSELDPWAKFDQYTGNAIDSTEALVCDTFLPNDKRPCRWGAAKNAYWTVVADPSIVVALGNLSELASGEKQLADSLREASWPTLVSFADAPVGPLVSDPILCQRGVGQLLFTLLVPDDVTVYACAHILRTDKLTQCSTPIDRKHNPYPVPVAVDFNEDINEPFDIYIIPKYETSAVEKFVVLDQLAYFADICLPTDDNTRTRSLTDRPSPATTTTPPTTTRRLTTTERWEPVTVATRVVSTVPSVTGINIFTNPSTRAPRSGTVVVSGHVPPNVGGGEVGERTNLCSLLNCDFNDGNCGYTQGGFFGTLYWQRRDETFGPPLSRHTDIKLADDTENYLGVLMHRDDERSAILESPEFSLTRLSYIHLDVYSATVGARVRICFDTYRERLYREYARRKFRRPRTTLKHCREVFNSIDVFAARRWHTVSALMIPGFEKFFIVADHVDTANKYIGVGIDNIRMSPCEQSKTTDAVHFYSQQIPSLRHANKRSGGSSLDGIQRNLCSTTTKESFFSEVCCVPMHHGCSTCRHITVAKHYAVVCCRMCSLCENSVRI